MTLTDIEAVHRFEAFVRNQPIPPCWEPVTPYDLESRRIAEGKHPQVILDTFQPQSILDYGCGFGTLLRFLKDLDPASGHRFTGYDPQAQEAARRVVPDGTFDLVICREVLEHVPVRQLTSVIRTLVSKSHRYLYVTTRYCQAPTHLLDYDTEDRLDPTHVTMLNKGFLRTLFILEGCKSRPDLEAKMDWQKKGRCLVFEVA
jgi:SAM-dependent methyltransferase